MASRKWCAKESRDKNLVSSQAFNRDYDTIKGVVNGGLDRTTTPNNWVTRAYIVDRAFHSTVLTTGVEIATQFQNGGNSSYLPSGITFQNYVGGWQTNTTFNTTGMKEGIAHIEMSWFAWCNDTYSDVNPKGVQFQVTWNGNIVAETGMFYQPWANPYICADFPIAGDGQLTMAWQFTSPLPSVESIVNTVSQMAFGGGQILFIGRFR